MNVAVENLFPIFHYTIRGKCWLVPQERIMSTPPSWFVFLLHFLRFQRTRRRDITQRPPAAQRQTMGFTSISPANSSPLCCGPGKSLTLRRLTELHENSWFQNTFPGSQKMTGFLVKLNLCWKTKECIGKQNLEWKNYRLIQLVSQ